jgi:hypothetical protein
MNKLTIKQGEAKTVTFTVKTIYGGVVDLTDATLLLGVKRKKTDTAYIFSHEDADFDKTQAEDGIVALNLTSTDTNQTEDDYLGELKCSWTGPPAVINKSADFKITILKSIT